MPTDGSERMNGPGEGTRCMVADREAVDVAH